MSARSTTRKYGSFEDIPRQPLSKKHASKSDVALAKAVAEDPDAAPLLDKEFWADAEIVVPQGKKQITLRIDADVLTWFRSPGKGYQSRINAVLRRYMEAHEK